MDNATEYITWRSSFSLNIPSFDWEHRRFIELMNELHAAIEHGDATTALRQTTLRLTAYARHHFRGEEEFMARIGYPGLERHQKEHAWFEERLDALPLHSANCALTVLTIMQNWLVHHILGTDKEYARWIEANAAALRATPRRPVIDAPAEAA